MTGYTKEEFYGNHMCIKDFQPFTPPEVIKTAIKKGFWSGESIFVHKDGHKIPASQVITTYKDSEGNLQGFTTITRDITEQKKTEEELRKSKENTEKQVERRTKELKELYESLEKQNKAIVRREIELAEAKKELEDRHYELNEAKNKLQEQSKHLEEEVVERTKELNMKVEELERFNELAVGRELKMVELKKKIRELEGKLKNQ